MVGKQRPPLTPAGCAHLGRGLDGLEVLRWESQSREGKRHYTYGTLDAAKDCSCEWRQHNPDTPCKHMLSFVDALRHHLGERGLLPGQAEVRCPECGYRCELVSQDDGEPGDEWRWTCYACETAWPASTLPVAPADPGGATGEPPELAGPTECEEAARDWRDELPPNFGTVAVTPEVLERAFGPTGTPPLAAVGVSAWGNLPATLDEAVADDGDRWIQSRTEAGVRLVCASCGAVRGWPTEVGAIDWLATDGVCGCGSGGPTPPASGAARKPLDEHFSLLYGDS